MHADGLAAVGVQPPANSAGCTPTAARPCGSDPYYYTHKLSNRVCLYRFSTVVVRNYDSTKSFVCTENYQLKSYASNLGTHYPTPLSLTFQLTQIFTYNRAKILTSFVSEKIAIIAWYMVHNAV